MAKTRTSAKSSVGDTIRVVNARENNLRNITVGFPIGKVTSVSGVSGSGKSSLVHQVVARVAERRFGRLRGVAEDIYPAYEPLVDSVEGLPPCVVVKQEPLRGSERSTIATYTRLIETLAKLYSTFGELKGVPSDPVAENADWAAWFAKHHAGKKATIAPLSEERLFTSKTQLPKSKVVFARDRTSEWTFYEPADLFSTLPNTLFVSAPAQSTTIGSAKSFGKIIDEVGTSWLCFVENELIVDNTWHRIASSEPLPYEPVTRRLFSFNSELRGTGRCFACDGRGKIHGVAKTKVISNSDKPILNGGLALPQSGEQFKNLGVLDSILRGLFFINGISAHATWNDLTEEIKNVVWNGSGSVTVPEMPKGTSKPRNSKRPFKGLRNLLIEKANSPSKSGQQFAAFIGVSDCEECNGTRYNRSARALHYHGVPFSTLVNDLTIFEIVDLIANFRQKASKAEGSLLTQLSTLLTSFVELNLGHLQLGRSTNTVSGGEAQRLRLGLGLSLSLTDCCYVLDEPSRALHPQDTSSLAKTINSLANGQNTVLMVEHNPLLIKSSDFNVELGPGGGTRGGLVVFDGAPRRMRSDDAKAPASSLKRTKGPAIRIKRLSQNNVRNVNFEIPTAATTAVVGVSGAGKSSAILGALAPAIQSQLEGVSSPSIGTLTVPKSIGFVEIVAQNLATSNRRSIVATAIGMFDSLRKHFESTDAAQQLGLNASDFSFNGKGACRGCGGIGIALDGHGNPLNQHCQLCHGNRFNEWASLCESDGLSIVGILNVPMSELVELNNDAISAANRETMRVACNLGLGHLQLGRVVPSLSAGERQRLSLVRFASKMDSRTSTGLLILDEPTAGLSIGDSITAFMELRQRLCETHGHTLVAVEHKLQLLPAVDWIIEFGPGGGPKGGQVIFQGTYKELLRKKTPTSDAINNNVRSVRGKSGVAIAVDFSESEHASEQAKHFEAFISRQEVLTDEQIPSALRPIIRLNSRHAPDDISVAELLDVIPDLVASSLPKAPKGIRYFCSRNELESAIEGHSFGFSPVGIQRRLGLVSASDFFDAAKRLVKAGFSNAVIAGKLSPLQDIAKLSPNQCEITDLWVICEADNSPNLRHLALAWGQGVVKLLDDAGKPAVYSTNFLPASSEDYRIGTSVSSLSVLDRRSPDGQCAYCMGTGKLPVYPLDAIIKNSRHTIDKDSFWQPSVLAGIRSLRRQRMIPEAKFYAKEGMFELLQPIDRMDAETRFLFEHGIPWRRFLKPIAKRSDREQDYYSWRGLHDYVYLSLNSMKDKSASSRLKEGIKDIDCPKCDGTGVSWESKQLVLSSTPRSAQQILSSANVSNFSKVLDFVHHGCGKAIKFGFGELSLDERIGNLSNTEIEKLFHAAAAQGPLKNLDLVNS